MYGSFPAAAAAATVTSKGLKLPHPPTAAFGSHLKEDVESELIRHRDHHHHQQHQMSSSLLRFRSAPSSLLGELCEDSLLSRPAIAGAVNKFAGFLTPDPSPQFRPPPSTQLVGSQQKAAFSSAPPMMYHHSQQQQLQMHLPNQSLAESSHRAAGLMPTEMQQVENGGGNRSSNLTRQSSSPAGLFSHLNVDNGYAMMRGLGGFRNEDLLPIRDAAKRQNSVMSQISEMGSEEISRSNPDEDSGCGRGYIPGVPVTSWEETPLLSGNNFSGIRIGREGEGKIVSGLSLSEPQNNGEMRNHVSDLTHQLSLPKTSATAIEKFLQFQDAIPCRVRAKRGCATHPRSIAERVRRTKISERMRKLQELVPNMDKQTNTADMLDLSVDYIKDLQKQVKALTEIRASCTCSSSKQKFSLSS